MSTNQLLQFRRKIAKVYDLIDELVVEANELGDDEVVEWVEEAFSSVEAAYTKVEAA